MFSLETFFKTLFEYFRTIDEELNITTQIRLKSWKAYKMFHFKNERFFNRAIHSLAFELLKCQKNCFSINHKDTDFISEDEDENDSVWYNYDYANYERIAINIRNLYITELSKIEN